MSSIFSALDTNNQNQSGKSPADINNMLKNMMDSIQNTKQAQMSPFENIAGISNFQFDTTDRNSISFSFEFKDLMALNKAYGKLKSSNTMNNSQIGNSKVAGEDFIYFIRKGNNLKFQTQRLNANKDLANGSEEEQKQLKTIYNTFSFETKISFEKSIKKASAKNINSEIKDNAVILRMNMAELFEDEPNPEVNIKLK